MQCGVPPLLIKLAAAVLTAVMLLSSIPYVKAQSIPAQLDVPFELGLGEQAIVESEHDIVVEFTEVIQDSRCPSDVVCIWQGQATISISVQVGNADPQEFMLTIGADESPAVTFWQHSVELLGLQPYPQSSVQVEPEDYVATLVVSKAPANSTGVFVRAAGDGVAAVAGWNLERGKGTLVLLSHEEGGTRMSVARFTPAAAPCAIPNASECIDGQVAQAIGSIGQGETIHLMVSNNTFFLTREDRMVQSLDIKRIKTAGGTGPTVELKEGERDGPLLVQEIGVDYISGLVFIEYPVAVSEGTPITLHVGDKATNGCTITLTLLEIRQDSAVFSKVVDESRPCPICWHKTS